MIPSVFSNLSEPTSTYRLLEEKIQKYERQRDKSSFSCLNVLIATINALVSQLKTHKKEI